nr:DUF3043 domain-containing protein [Nanchangia anserum]
MPWKSTDEAPEPAASTTPVGKGRPTPKRRDAEKRNQRPLVGSKKESKERRRRQREVAYARQRAALEGHGDERYLPVNDRGDHRKYIRNFIDARWSLSEFVMPLFLLIIIAMFVLPYAWSSAPTVARMIPMYAFYIVFIACFLEWVITTRRVNAHLVSRSGGDKSVKRGNGRYVAYRMTTPRRLRQPVPMVKRGEK